MRQKQRQIIAMCTILTMLLPLLAGCGSHVTGPNNTDAQGVGNVMTTEKPEESDEEVTEKTTEDIRETEAAETEEPSTAEATTEALTKEEETTEAVTEPEELFEYEVSFEEIKREVLTVYPGREDGQVQYTELPSGIDGPRGFAVVDDVIYILDTMNFRVNIYDDGNFRSIPFEERFTGMIVQNDRIVLSDITNGTKISVYKTDGTLEATNEFVPYGEIDWINKFFCIGDTYVEFVSTSNYKHGRYRYDWSTDKVTFLGKYEQSVDKVHASILSEKKQLSVIGEDGESVYYTYYESNDSGMLPEYILSREEGNARWYTKVDIFAWYTRPLEYFYLAEDGKLYVMECFEDRIVISEVPLGPDKIAKEDRFVSDTVIEVELQTDLDYYRIDVEEIRKEGDGYVITGDKIYGGIVVLTVDQKEALDNGALLRLMYEGKEVECIIVGMLENGKPFYFPKNSEAPYIHSSEHIETNVGLGDQKEAVIDALAKEPYNGVGYYFDDEMIGMKYDLILEKGFICTVSADLPIDPVCYKAYRNPNATGDWTMERFYEEAIVRDKWTHGPLLDVYTENGEIVRIYEPFSI